MIKIGKCISGDGMLAVGSPGIGVFANSSLNTDSYWYAIMIAYWTTAMTALWNTTMNTEV